MIAGVEAEAAYCGSGHAESQFHAQPEFSLGLVHLGRSGDRLLHLRHEAAVVDPLSGRVCHDRHVVHWPERVGDVAGLRRGDVRRLVADATRLLTRLSHYKSETKQHGLRSCFNISSPSNATPSKVKVGGSGTTSA